MPIRKRFMSNRRIPFFILILASIAMAGTTFAQTYPASAAVPAGAVAVALLALTFSFDVVALGYIISKIFPQTGINEWLPNEYWEIAKSAILIVSIYALLAFATNVSTSLIPTSLSTGRPHGGRGSNTGYPRFDAPTPTMTATEISTSLRWSIADAISAVLLSASR